ncbi:hypothetical protein [Kitasatospora sp. NPDC008115]|uniref:hypothetical protein n=1 Tax=Kitasatospora sp. NPDC008115 TaxID=3364022 RepID=UPI0036EF44AB
MTETRPRGQEQGAAGRDGVERRRPVGPGRGAWSAWRSPGRMRSAGTRTVPGESSMGESAAPNRVRAEPLLSVRTTLVLLTATVIGVVVGVLAFLAGGPVAGAVLAGLTATGTSVPVLNGLIQ